MNRIWRHPAQIPHGSSPQCPKPHTWDSKMGTPMQLSPTALSVSARTAIFSRKAQWTTIFPGISTSSTSIFTHRCSVMRPYFPAGKKFSVSTEPQTGQSGSPKTEPMRKALQKSRQNTGTTWRSLRIRNCSGQNSYRNRRSFCKISESHAHSSLYFLRRMSGTAKRTGDSCAATARPNPDSPHLQHSPTSWAMQNASAKRISVQKSARSSTPCPTVHRRLHSGANRNWIQKPNLLMTAIPSKNCARKPSPFPRTKRRNS